MDTASPSPPKRPRNIDILTAQLKKPTRFFPFNRKTPSNTLQGKTNRTERVSAAKNDQAVVSSSLQSLPFSSSMKFVPNKEANISNKLQKLKLKSPDGRDLGEINVQLLPQKGDGLGGKTIMLQKHSLFGKLDNPSNVSILKPIEKCKQIAVQGGFPIQTPIVRSNQSAGVSFSAVPSIAAKKSQINPCSVAKHKLEPRHSPLILRHSEISKYPTAALGSKVFYINVDKQTGLNTVKTMNTLKPIPKSQIPSNQKIIMVQAESYPDSTEGSRSNSFGTGLESRSVALNRDEASTDSASSTSNARSLTNIFWNPSKYAELVSKASSQKSKGIDNEIVEGVGNVVTEKSITIATHSLEPEHIKISSKSSNALTAANILNRKQKPKLNNWTIRKTSGKKPEQTRTSSTEFDSIKEAPTNGLEVTRVPITKKITVHNLNSENTQNVTSTTNNILIVDSKKTDESSVQLTHMPNIEDKSNGDPKLGENIMVVVPGEWNATKESEKNDSKQKVASHGTHMEVDNDLTTDASSFKISRPPVIRHFNFGKTSKPNASLPKQHDLDIIEKALSSCLDQTLRDKALKALADCGIGVKRDVPVPPKVSVCDSQTQTTVFSILKPDVFVEANENSPSLKRLKIVSENPCELPTVSIEPMQTLISECSVPPEVSGLQDDFLTLLDDLYVPDASKSEVDQIKDIFSKPPPEISRAAQQIKADFEAATKFDDDGLLGIHRAVLDGNIQEVQRQLIVLKAVNETIEVPTEDGKTSLELAVLNGIDRSIINTLLAAGAKPAIPAKLHESALIIAAKISSRTLPDLIPFVQPSSLLDNEDAEGVAPLHYCSQLANIEGVKLLVNAGANIDLRDAKSGRTPLFYALENKNFDIAWYLIDNGASPAITNFAGQLPAALVDEYRQNTLAEKLNQAAVT